MIEATSCGGVVIFRGKILLLYKNYKNKYEGWVLPKGTVEAGEEYPDTATREVLGGDPGVKAAIIKICRQEPVFLYGTGGHGEKDVHWYLMWQTVITASRSGKNILLIPDIISITKRIIS